MLNKILIVSLVLVGGCGGPSGLNVGDPAPDFVLAGSDGKTYRLSDFKGKQAVVIAWFPKAFTGGWTKQCKSFRANGAELRKFNVAYFTASCAPLEGKKGNTNFAKSLDADYPILSDPSKETAKKYGVVSGIWPLPRRWTFYIGKDGKILKIDKDVSPSKDGANAAMTLKELGIETKHSIGADSGQCFQRMSVIVLFQTIGFSMVKT